MSGVDIRTLNRLSDAERTLHRLRRIPSPARAGRAINRSRKLEKPEAVVWIAILFRDGMRVHFEALPLTAALAEYESHAVDLLEARRGGDEGALKFFHEHLPRMFDDKILWLPKRLTGDELRAAVFDLDDARTAVARGYDIAGWEAPVAFVVAIERCDAAVWPGPMP